MFGSSWKENEALRRVSKSEGNINDILPSKHLESIELFWCIFTGAFNFEKGQPKGKKKNCLKKYSILGTEGASSWLAYT